MTTSRRTAAALLAGWLLCSAAFAQSSNRDEKLSNIRLVENFPGATADVQIRAAIADLPAAGGIVDARGYGATTQTIASPLIIGLPAKVVTLLIDRATTFKVTVSTGEDAICLHSGSAIVGNGTGTSSRITGFRLQEGARVASLLASCPNDGSSEFFFVQGIVLTGDTSAKTRITQALVDLRSVFVNSAMRDVVIQCFPGIGLQLRNLSNGAGFGPALFENLWINGTAGCDAPHNRPVVISSVARGGLMAGIVFLGGAFEHAGASEPIVEINSSARASISGVSFLGSYLETSGGSGHGFHIVDARGVYLAGVSAGGRRSSGDLVHISRKRSEAAVTVDRVSDVQPVFANLLRNVATGYTSGQIGAGLAHYACGGAEVAQTPLASTLTGSGAIRHLRADVGCTTAPLAGAACSSPVLAWPGEPSPDLNYTVTCTLESAQGQPHISSVRKTSRGFTATIAADTNVAATATINCVAVHD